MISEKQLTANRQNAERSTGPTTDEGKKTSALNARRHHLTGQVSTMTEGDRLATTRSRSPSSETSRPKALWSFSSPSASPPLPGG